MKPIVYKNFGTNIYLQFQEDEEFDFFIRLHTGTVEITKLRKDETAQLQILGTDQIHSAQHCAQIFLESSLPKANERVVRILTDIKEGKELPKFIGLQGSHGTLETQKLSRREKMDLVGKGAADIAKKHKRPDPQPTGDGPTDRPAPVRRPGGTTNLVELAEICAELLVDPTDARKAIRGANWTKPGGRWAWDKDKIDQIRADLKQLMEKK